MMSKTFVERFNGAIEASGSLLCIGLDPDPERMAIPDVTAFNREIVDATADLVCAYKPQLAFYEALGSSGLASLEETVRFIRERAPRAVIIGDGKRGDIGSTAEAYARAMFETWDFDAATVNVYQGRDAIEPFLGYPGRGVFAVCRTSNVSSSYFQDLEVDGGGPMTLYRYVARSVERWSAGAGNVGLVVGATAPDQLAELRRHHPRLPFLVPGIGAQGGDVRGVIERALDADRRGATLSSSRQILYASSDPKTFAAAARNAARAIQQEIADALERL